MSKKTVAAVVIAIVAAIIVGLTAYPFVNISGAINNIRGQIESAVQTEKEVMVESESKPVSEEPASEAKEEPAAEAKPKSFWERSNDLANDIFR
jgi:hypothetical protein